MHVFHLTFYSHFFKLTQIQARALPIINRFCMQNAIKQWVKENRRNVLKVTKVFAVRTRDKKEYRFHIGQLEDFYKALQMDHITSDMYTSDRKPMYVPTNVYPVVQSGWVLKDYQEEAHTFIIDESGDDNHSRLVAMATGTGKTFTALFCTQTLKTRTLIVVLSGYVDKWVQDIEKTIVVEKGDIVVVQGGKSMKDLTYSENTAKYIVISLNTIKNYFKAYEEHPGRIEDDGYAYPPEELCERLDIGSIIIDEVHQHLHAVYKLLTYTHVPKIIALSATLMSDDMLIKHIQHQMFPKEIRFDKVKMDQYIRCYATSYFFNDINKEKIRTTEFGSNTYSHNAFEKSVLRRHHVVENYMKLINNLLHTGYIEHYKHGDKAAIYVSSIAMADYTTQWFKRKYPDLDIRRYVEDDPYENVIDADIRITTVLSAGTAIDIPNLVAVIMTINMKSSVFNLQTLGRLRKIPGRVVKFYWLYCSQLGKHKEFHDHRKEIFQDRVESIKEFHYPYGL